MPSSQTHTDPAGAKPEDQNQQDKPAGGDQPGRASKPRNDHDAAGGVDTGAIQPGQTGGASAL